MSISAAKLLQTRQIPDKNGTRPSPETTPKALENFQENFTNEIESSAIAHWHEWQASGVSSEIIEANVQSYFGQTALEVLTEAAIAKVQRVESYVTEPAKRILKRNENVLNGGWFVTGLDPLNNWKRMEWGQFKPHTPRLDTESGKPIKYQSPEGLEARAILLAIPSQPTFWADLISASSIPIYICEGAKKAGLLLSLGYAAIALPGIWMGGRWKDKQGKLPDPHLIPELAAFAQPGRKFIFVFDQDEKPKTQRAVAAAIRNTAKLLEAQSCEVQTTIWDPSEGKGIDDVWTNYGADRVGQILAAAAPISESEVGHRDRLIAKRRQKFLELLPTISNDFQLTAAPGRVIELYQGFTPIFDVNSARTILIQGWLAAGKTHAIIESLRGLSNRQIIWLAPRNGLLRGTAKRIEKAIGLTCYHYQDDAGLHRQMLLAGEPGVYLMAPDSLKSYSTGHDAGKVFDWSKAIVIADEFSGIRKEILSKSQSFPEFERALREAGTFIAADAFLSNADCKIIGRYRQGDRRILAQMPSKSPKKIQWIQTRTKEGLISMTHQGISIALMDQWISEGIRSIAIATDNLLEGKIAQKYLELRGIKVLLICSETPEENHKYLPNPDECLQFEEIEANIITPTLQSGGDIQTRFDRGIVLATGILQPTQIMQIMGRFRQCHNWVISAPMYTQEAAITFSSLDSKKIEQWAQKLGDGFDDLGIARAIETFSWGVWAEVTSEVEKGFNSEYLHHLLAEYFESVQTVEFDLTGYRGKWKELLTEIKNEDAKRTITADLAHGRLMLKDERQPQLNREIWDLKLAVMAEKYPKTVQRLIDEAAGAPTEDLVQAVRIYSSSRLNRLKWYSIATESDEAFNDADLLQSMQEQFTCSTSARFTAYKNIRLFRELNLAALVRCERRAGEVLANVDHFCAESPKIVALFQQFGASPQLRNLFAMVDDLKGFWEVVKRCLSFMGYQKTSGGNARIDTQTPHKNGSYSSGQARFSNSKSCHHTGWLLMECSGSKFFREEKMFEPLMKDIRALIQREAQDRDKWRSPYPPDIPKAA